MQKSLLNNLLKYWGHKKNRCLWLAANAEFVMDIVEKELLVTNKWGLHGRTSAMLVETARKYEADIWLVRDDAVVDCKSILDVMTMACTQGTPVVIRAKGVDAEAALADLAELMDNKFGEE